MNVLRALLVSTVFLIGVFTGGVVERIVNSDEPPVVRILALSLDENTVCHVLTVDGVPVDGGAIFGCRDPR